MLRSGTRGDHHNIYRFFVKDFSNYSPIKCLYHAEFHSVFLDLDLDLGKINKKNVQTELCILVERFLQKVAQDWCKKKKKKNYQSLSRR